MFPIRDHNPSRNTPYVTYALLLANIVVFLAYFPALSGDPSALGAFWDAWAIVPAEITSGSAFQTLKRFAFDASRRGFPDAGVSDSL